MYKKIDLTFEEVWIKMDRYRELLLVHLASDMTPHLLDNNTKKLYSIPEEMLIKIKDRYRKKYERITYVREDD